ncbi:JAB domain-containing protein [Lysinibacillus sphaericus]|uniref:DNA repair protein RadC n=2 Tax=Lysinibacillus sphaericus TaxID=1421 RepID=A0A6H0A0R0_LYSSH|nr:DNA repair protein RadC [Lysinibacillus sphaericus]MBE5085790.1 DNA repair protein RadC [Bacillus thuringiensis]ACA42363.1 DNA repair protein radC-like protein [Lysinibacillus sphaericus C3-41]AMO35345.1 DNA repair protein RadC [Lysinibacillus sphaericus]AMR93052.1 DNA repair protein RadC [Lysinibacillus sphaericus]MBG9710608.1 DNA repair protein RadC [Lysinibacillus sphaericus]
MEEIYERIEANNGEITEVPALIQAIIGRKKDISTNLKVLDLFDMTIVELQDIGLSRKEALRIRAVKGLLKIMNSERQGKVKSISNASEAAEYVMDEMKNLKQEHFVCLFLDTRSRVIKKETIFIGSLNSSIASPREIMRLALKYSAAGIICLHNHCSGDSEPSMQDLEVTRRLFEAGDLMGVELIDHIVIGNNEFTSIRENNLL